MPSILIKTTPNYAQHEPHIHRNCPLDSPGRILACLANIFTSVPLRIQKSKRHAARFCLPCVQSPSSLCSCAGCVCVRLCQRNVTKYFKMFLCFLSEHLRIRASKHPNGRGGCREAQTIFPPLFGRNPGRLMGYMYRIRAISSGNVPGGPPVIFGGSRA